MKRRISFRQYRAIDLALFAAMLCVSEWLLVTAATRWFPDQLYTVSLVGALTAIVMLRWGPWAAIHAALGGLVFALASHGSGKQLLIYAGGNLLSLVMLLPLRRLGGEKIRSDAFLSVCFGLAALLRLLACTFDPSHLYPPTFRSPGMGTVTRTPSRFHCRSCSSRVPWPS